MNILYFVLILVQISNIICFYSFDTVSCVRDHYKDFFTVKKELVYSRYDEKICLYVNDEPLIYKSKMLYLTFFQCIRWMSLLFEQKELSITNMKLEKDTIIIDWSITLFILFYTKQLNLQGRSLYILDENNQKDIVKHYLSFHKLTNNLKIPNLYYQHPSQHRPIRVRKEIE